MLDKLVKREHDNLFNFLVFVFTAGIAYVTPSHYLNFTLIILFYIDLFLWLFRKIWRNKKISYF